MKNIIYTIKTENLNQENWWKVTLPTIKEYAKKISCDLKIITTSNFTKVPNNYFLLFECFKDFESTNYDRLLYLDLDILIKKQSENIFETITNGFHILEECCDRIEETDFFKYSLMLKIKKEKIKLYNTGVILSDREDILEINKSIPTNIYDFYEKYKIKESSSIAMNQLKNTEEPYFCFILAKSKIKINNLGYRWNSDPIHINKCNFIHYIGNRKKMLTEKF